ncbi:MAG: type I secretion system permease/ATPase [Pseudomonadota bacterium]
MPVVENARASLGAIGVRRLIGAAILFSVFTNLLMLTGPLYMLQIYDRVLGSRSEETLVALTALVAGLYLFYWLIEYARGRVMARVGARIQAELAGPVFRASIERSALKNARDRGGVSDLENVRNALSSPVLLALFDLPWTPLFFLGIFIFHQLLGWLALAGGALLIVVAICNQVLTAKKTLEGARAGGAAAKFSRQAEHGGEFIWSQGMVNAMTSRWTNMQARAVDENIAANDWTSSFTAFSKSFRLFLQSAMLGVGAWLVLEGQLTAGAMIAGSILLGRALAPVEVIVSQWQMVQRAMSGWRDLGALLDSLPEREAPHALPVPEAHLEVRSIAVMSGQSRKPVLSQISFEIKPGEALGVIGRSGSGKTTLARVVVGLVLPVSGEVRLGGATIEQYGPETYGSHIGYLPQEVRLFAGTVAENIAQMALNPDPEAVIEAAKRARVHDIILKFPDGYDTRIDEADAQLSGGQRQRLALARALYGNPVLLVLDEPNSALDADGSEALNAAVTQMKAEGRSVVIMTHRPTAISACDKLLVVEAGQVAAHGPRDEVIKSMMKNAGDVRRVVGQGRS